MGADGAACNNNLDLFMEMRLAALIHTPRAGVNAVSAMQALEMATVLGARALGLESEIGSIEEGKRADLALVDRSRIHSSPRTEDVVGPLVYSARASDVTDLVIDGRLVMSDGDLLTLDEERVVALAAEEAHRLHARVESV